MRFHIKKVVRFLSFFIILYILSHMISFQEEFLSGNYSKKSEKLSLGVREQVTEASRIDTFINETSKSHCKKLKPIDPNIRETFTFQNISAEPDFVAFSAFYSEQPEDVYFIKIVGIGSYKDNKVDKTVPYPKHCQMWFQHKDAGDDTVKVYNEVVPTVIQIMPELKGKRYHPVLFLCYGPKHYKLTRVPYAVSLVEHRCQEPLNALKVINTKKEAKAKPKLDFGVCVTPFNFKYNKTLNFVENLEIQKMFGAQHFTFYNFSLSDQMKPVLESYASEGNITIIPWRLPPHLKVDIWPHVSTYSPNIFYFAQLGALNDCLYRNMYRFKYLLFSDLDEIFVPRKDKDWNSMIKSATAVKGFHKDAISYMFRNTFFRMDWGSVSDDKTLSDKRLQLYHPNSLLYVNRETRIWNAGSRSKYMLVNAQCVSLVGVHQVWGHLSGKKCQKRKSMIMATDTGLLHHYRNWRKPGEKTTSSVTKDDNIFRFKNEIIDRIEARFHKITSRELIEYIS